MAKKKKVKSVDEKLELLSAIEADKADGMTTPKAAKRHGVSVSNYYSWKRKLNPAPMTDLAKSPAAKKLPKAKGQKLVVIIGDATTVGELLKGYL